MKRGSMTMKPTLLTGPLLAGLILAIATPALAQSPAPAPTPEPISDEALADKLTRDADLADQNRRSNALNVEINRKNRAVQARNDAAKAAFDKAVADYHGHIAAQEAAYAKVQADYQKRVEAWKADVAACKAGDAGRCGPPPPAKGAPASKPAVH
jgi:hypothetical protein